MAIAIVHFRTMKNGAYKWIKRGQRRGYWRVIVVRDLNGSRSVASRNVVSVPYIGPEGIDGVTSRSGYYIDGSFEAAARIAAKINRQALASAMLSHYSPVGA